MFEILIKTCHWKSGWSFHELPPVCRGSNLVHISRPVLTEVKLRYLICWWPKKQYFHAFQKFLSHFCLRILFFSKNVPNFFVMFFCEHFFCQIFFSIFFPTKSWKNILKKATRQTDPKVITVYTWRPTRSDRKNKNKKMIRQ